MSIVEGIGSAIILIIVVVVLFQINSQLQAQTVHNSNAYNMTVYNGQVLNTISSTPDYTGIIEIIGVIVSVFSVSFLFVRNRRKKEREFYG